MLKKLIKKAVMNRAIRNNVIDFIKERSLVKIEIQRNINPNMYSNMVKFVNEHKVISRNEKLKITPTKLADEDADLLTVRGGEFLIKYNGLPYVAIFKQRMDGDNRIFSCEFYCSRFHTDELKEVLKIIYPVEHRTPRVLTSISKNSSRMEAIGILDSHYGTQKQFILKETYDEIDKRVKRMMHEPDYYRKMNLPRKETFMFYGPPGTGKTTVSRHFAVKYGMDVINTVPADLAMVIRNLQVPTIVVLDDIDAEPELCIPEPVSKDAGSYAQLAAITSSASYGKFINILDGTMPLNNVVIFMSTNYIKKLRPAIYRKGRVDCIMKLDYMDVEKVIEFCEPNDVTANLVRDTYTKGDIVIGMFPELINVAEDFDDWVRIIESHKLETEVE